jgi:hypothetical protein
MLTKHQRALIEERKGGKKRKVRGDWKTGDYALRKYLKDQLDSITELLEIIDVLPEKQIKKTINPKQIINILKVLEKMLVLNPPGSIEKDMNENDRAIRHYRINAGSKFKGLDNAIVFADVLYEASEEEAQLSRELTFLRDFFLHKIFKGLNNDHIRCNLKEFYSQLDQIIEKRKKVIVVPRGDMTGDLIGDSMPSLVWLSERVILPPKILIKLKENDGAIFYPDRWYPPGYGEKNAEPDTAQYLAGIYSRDISS